MQLIRNIKLMISKVYTQMLLLLKYLLRWTFYVREMLRMF